ncbi:hypothetical protein DFH11DRAFT_1562033 [Phellopilus nigrolimitatus]|nr:hypothetical protein DFH11DRAFT_1562033 [Phellopilus nigrolimitatus]
MTRKENMKQVGTDADLDEPSYNPPSYDYATGSDVPASGKHPVPSGPDTYKPSSPETVQPPSPYVPGPSMTPGGMVYHYQNPTTGHIISTVLPPDHPEMLCMREGRHVRSTRFGLLGVLAAVFWFPLGIGLCLLDRRVVCTRCGHVIDDGFSC